MKPALVLCLFIVTACSVAADREGSADPVFDFDPVASAAIQDYLDGRAKAPARAQVHADAAPGHFCEFTTTIRSGDEESASRTLTQCVARDGDRVWIEHSTGRGYVLALLVDLARPPEANVVGAWVGRPGDPGMPIKVADPLPPADTAGVSEAFSLTLAGREWQGRVFRDAAVGVETSSWVADDGWFSGVIRHTSLAAGSELITELTRHGTTASPLLRWSH